MLDEVSDITKMPFDKLWNLNVDEFFTYLTYSRFKAKRMKEQLDKYKHTKVF